MHTLTIIVLILAIASLAVAGSRYALASADMRRRNATARWRLLLGLAILVAEMVLLLIEHVKGSTETASIAVLLVVIVNCVRISWQLSHPRSQPSAREVKRYLVRRRRRRIK